MKSTSRCERIHAGRQLIVSVSCLDYENLRESTEGFAGRAVVDDHPLLSGIDVARMPLILGYNIVKPRDDCDVVAVWNETDDSKLAVGQFDAGRVLAYTSDPFDSP